MPKVVASGLRMKRAAKLSPLVVSLSLFSVKFIIVIIY